MKTYYDHDGITVYHGDAREVLPTLGPGTIDLIVTDPPYGCNNNNGDLRGNAKGNSKMKAMQGSQVLGIAQDGPEEADALATLLFSEAKRLLVPGRACCCFCGGGGPIPRFARWTLLMEKVLGFKMCVIWEKTGTPGIGWHYRRCWECILVSKSDKWNGGLTTRNVIHYPKPTYDNIMHPNEKPEGVIGFFIRNHSDPGDLILDPFAGSLTTAVVARKLGRRCIAIELEERWIEIGIKRLQQTQLPYEAVDGGITQCDFGYNSERVEKEMI